MENNENKNLCAICRGKNCCRQSGCVYYVSDFDIVNAEVLNNLLSLNRTSIVAHLNFEKDSNGKLFIAPILYLRSRNVGREIVDLVSFKSQCLSWSESGCFYDFAHRPGSGKSLIPHPSMHCNQSIDVNKEIIKWLPYQNILADLVLKYSGLDIWSKLKEDIEKLFFDLLDSANNETVAMLDLVDFLAIEPMLKEIYPEEYQNALDKFNNTKKRN